MANIKQRRARLFELPGAERVLGPLVDPAASEAPDPRALPSEPTGAATLKLSKEDSAVISDEIFPVVRVVAGPDMFAYVVLDDDSEAVVGRDEKADLVLRDASVSRMHASFRTEGDERCVICDLGSTNGVSFEGRQVRTRVLLPGSKVLVGSVSLRFEVLGLQEYAHLRRVNRQIRMATNRDPLTNLHLRNYLDDGLPLLISNCERYDYDFSLAFIDLDHFKLINDTYGHAVGDAVLAQVARIGLHTCRETDVLVRYGGEELVLFMPNTDEKGATVAAERLRIAIRDNDWSKTTDGLEVTASFGVAELLDDETIEALLERADKAMYRAKDDGRDRVIFASLL